MYINKVKDLIKKTFEIQIKTGVRQSIMLEGPPGCGKSEAVTQVCEELSKEWGTDVACRPFFLNTCEQPDVAGTKLPVKDDEGNWDTVSARAPWMPRKDDPEHGVVFLDEFRQAGHDVQKPAAELLLNGRVGASALPITYLVVGATNGEAHRSGVQRSLAFIDNRVSLIKVEPNAGAWVDWAERKGVHPLAIAFAKYKPGLVFGGDVPPKGGPFCTPRSLVKLSHFIGELSIDALTELAQGTIGEGTGAEFLAFLRVAEQLPTFEEIVAAPAKVPVPDRPDASYAAMQMLAHRMDDKTALPAFTYLKRMGREQQVAALKAVFKRAPTLMATPDFSAWVRENKDLVLAANLLEKRK